MKKNNNFNVRNLLNKKLLMKLCTIILGSFLFSVAINLFIVPSNLY